MKYINGLALASLCALAPAWATAQTSVGAGQTPAPAASTDSKPLIPAEMAARYAHAQWTYPGADVMANSYPRRAQDERQEGAATILCVIASDGQMDRCYIARESPKNEGFGMATAAAFVKYARVDPATVEGGIKPGDFKLFTYIWQLG